MDMKVHFVINVSDIQDANMANVMNLGLAIVKKAGVAFFATKIWIIAQITTHAKMAPPVLTPVKALTPVLAHLVGLATVVKPE